MMGGIVLLTDERQSQHAETDDEGIERDSGDCEDDLTHHITLDKVIQPAESHYRAVCRALVAEALELSSFLDKFSQGKVKTEIVCICYVLVHVLSYLSMFQYCGKQVSQPAESHYRAVCRALVAEALELSSFLDKFSQGKVKTEIVCICYVLVHVLSYLSMFQYCGKQVSQPAESHYRAVYRALVAEALELSSFLDKFSQGKVKTEIVCICYVLVHVLSYLSMFQYCGKQVSQPAESHYRAVCRALVAEALELSSFLDKVSQGKVKAETVSACTDLQNLHLSDWTKEELPEIRR
ncbi:actin nucleation factor [Homalodisca vitripennis]|nr:actin nucleation factor [Homalodisca vitripennis]